MIMAKQQADLFDIEEMAIKATQIKAILKGLDPAVSTEVMSLVLLGRSNEEILAIMNATKARYQRMTGRDIMDKMPKIKIKITRE
jgi:hypothetical protein